MQTQVSNGLISQILNEHFFEAKSRNSIYSYRSFAKKLGISPGTLSEILNSRRKISIRMAARLAERLQLDPQRKWELLNSVQKEKLGLQSVADQDYVTLESSQFALIAEWPYLALLSLMRTKEFKSQIPWIAKRLRLSIKEATFILERLEKLNLIKKDIEGNWQRSFERIRTTDAIKDAAIHSAHTKDLALIQKSLEEVPLNWRDVTSITMPIDTKKLTEAKRLIRQFQDDLSELLESGESNEVYRMSIALFPLSEIPSRKREFIK